MGILAHLPMTGEEGEERLSTSPQLTTTGLKTKLSDTIKGVVYVYSVC